MRKRKGPRRLGIRCRGCSSPAMRDPGGGSAAGGGLQLKPESVRKHEGNANVIDLTRFRQRLAFGERRTNADALRSPSEEKCRLEAGATAPDERRCPSIRQG